jgi:colicin import membrane protein
MAKTETVVIADEYRDKYTVDDKVRTASGGKSISCGDQVAQALNGLTVDQLARVAKSAGLDLGKWKHLNPGMQRMNLGNSMRARMENGDNYEKEDIARIKKALSEAKAMTREGKVVEVKKAVKKVKEKAKKAKRMPKAKPAPEAVSA